MYVKKRVSRFLLWGFACYFVKEGMDQELYYQMALSMVPGVGPVMAKSLIAYCGSAEAVFTEKKSRLGKIPYVGGISAEAIYAFRDFELIDREVAFIEKNNIRAIHYHSPEYPLRLKQELDSPLVLYVKGSANLNQPRIAAIVGTRKCTLTGAEVTRRIVEGLKPFGAAVISGLAYGIDVQAHKACLEYDVPTLAVVGHGLDVIYPGQHRPTAAKMVEQGGAIISEHFSGTALNPDLFPRRNRIVAAFCDCIVVVESKLRGGSMITAEIAAGYNRDVFAVPGRPTDTMSEGCNYLIKNLKAGLCENAEDIAKAMNWDLPDVPKTQQAFTPSLFQELSADERKVIEHLQPAPRHFDQLLINTQIPVNKLSFVLLEMEMKGMLKTLPGKRFELLR